MEPKLIRTNLGADIAITSGICKGIATGDMPPEPPWSMPKVAHTRTEILLLTHQWNMCSLFIII
jgi:hypothetical protein